MLYIGYPITKATAYNIFNQPGTANIEAYIRSKRLRLYDIADEDFCVLGLAVNTLSRPVNAYLSRPVNAYMSADDAIITIINYKKKVVRRLNAAMADLSHLDFESGPMAMTFDDYAYYLSDSDASTLPPPSPPDWQEEVRRADTPDLPER